MESGCLSPDLVRERVVGTVEVAREFGTQVPLDRLVELMPEGGPGTPKDLAAWIRAHPEWARIASDRAAPPEAPAFEPTQHRRERANRYWQAAESLTDSESTVMGPWLRFLAVTGSTAYGEPEEGDDCDLMAVVRPGTVWVFLALMFARLRMRRSVPAVSPDPPWCLNYVLDERAAITTYGRPRGFLFAREALVVRPVRGGDYYRSLLRRAGWLGQEAPRLYARWDTDTAAEPAEPGRAPLTVRGLNLLMFPLVAFYLQLKGLWHNHRLRGTGEYERGFRTVTRLDRMVLETRKFERLSTQMRPASRLSPE